MALRNLNSLFRFMNTVKKHTLPFCLISCLTIKQLELEYVDFCFPASARLGIIFPSVTYLRFDTTKFKRNASGVPLKIPNLEELVFFYCIDMDNFVISAPKLKSLTFTECSLVTEWRWFELHFPVIKTLMFCAHMFTVRTWPFIKFSFFHNELWKYMFLCLSC
ncbi:unnamed protein product [Cuscuta epithymum]|uniref:Leucine-rich repeat domain, L domain-containing protein n=1 Tax=Cuscuta epithymum TaxID=186058 RepID=A0AAV0CRL7_9ASTE|nr:unnamed protein product [Cuscuta epithymum]CAH9083082.1 unnamed protein product [Cuscuta epithymum]